MGWGRDADPSYVSGRTRSEVVPSLRARRRRGPGHGGAADYMHRAEAGRSRLSLVIEDGSRTLPTGTGLTITTQARSFILAQASEASENAADVTVLVFADVLLGFHGRPGREPPVIGDIRQYLAGWPGVGLIAAGMARQQYDLRLTRYGQVGCYGAGWMNSWGRQREVEAPHPGGRWR